MSLFGKIELGNTEEPQIPEEESKEAAEETVETSEEVKKEAKESKEVDLTALEEAPQEEKVATLIHFMQRMNPYDYAPWMLTKEARQLIKQARERMDEGSYALADDLRYPINTRTAAILTAACAEKMASLEEKNEIMEVFVDPEEFAKESAKRNTLGKMKAKAKNRTGKALPVKSVKKY